MSVLYQSVYILNMETFGLLVARCLAVLPAEALKGQAPIDWDQERAVVNNMVQIS